MPTHNSFTTVISHAQLQHLIINTRPNLFFLKLIFWLIKIILFSLFASLNITIYFGSQWSRLYQNKSTYDQNVQHLIQLALVHIWKNKIKFFFYKILKINIKFNFFDCIIIVFYDFITEITINTYLITWNLTLR